MCPPSLPNRGYDLLVEIRGACEVVVDDGVTDAKDTIIVGLRKKHESRPRAHGALAIALRSYVKAGRSLATELSEFHGFDMALLDEAQKVSDLLLARNTGATGGAHDVRARRNRIVHLLRGHLKRLRKLTRHVFRKHPAIVRDMASAFARERAGAAGDDVVDDDDTDPTDDDVDNDEPVDGDDGTADDDTAPTPEPNDDPV